MASVQVAGVMIESDGEGSRAAPSVARELADKIRGAKAVVLHRCGHWTPIEKVKECEKLLSDFLRGIPI
jgi:3-oxoadipate enol-lactonase